MNLSRFSTITAIALLTLISSSITTGMLPGRSIQVLAQTQDNRQAEADRLAQQAWEQYQTSQFQAALQSWQQALEIYREIGDRTGEGIILNNIGGVYANQGQYPQALEFYQQALSIAQAVGDRAGEGTTLNGIGRVYLDQGQYPQALEFYQQALSIARAIGDRAGEGTTLNGIGGVYLYQGQYPQALESFQQALSIARAIGDPAGEGATLNNIGRVYLYQGQYPQALESLQQALSIARAIGDRAGEGTTLNGIGRVYLYQGQYPQALESFQQALSIAREVDNRAGEGNILDNMGKVYFYQGQYPQALESFQQALSIARAIGDWAGEGTTLNNIGNVYLYQGQYPQALGFYQQALSIAREVGNRAEEGTTLNNIGEVYRNLGQYPQALESLQQALFIVREVGDRAGEGTTFSNIGNVYLYQGQYPQALESLQQALFIVREVGDRAGEGTILNNIGNVYLYQGQYSQALGSYQQALSIAREVGSRAGEGTILNNIGNVYANQGLYPQALESYQQALSIAQEVGDRAGEGTILSSIGASLFELGQLQSAEAELLEAITVLDALRQQDFTDADRISLFDTQVVVYDVLQQVQIAQNKIEPALEASERGRARPFVSLLSQRLQQAETTANLPAPSVSDIQQTARAQNATLVQYSVISTTVGTPAIYIWVIPPTGDIAFRSIELNEANQRTLSGAIATAFGENTVFRSGSTTISNLVSNVRPTDRSASRDIEFEYNPGVASDNLRQLHQLLIEPIADLLPTNESDRIVFIPQGGLFLVPFAALQDANGDYLIENHTISIAPSIQILDLTRQQASPDQSLDNALVVGNPEMPTVWDTQSSTDIQLNPLPGAEQEAQAIAQFLNTEAIIGNAATETAVTQQMPDAQIIHLATHGLLEYGIPSESGVLDVPGAIALTPSASDDGLLTSAEILEMELQAELVVLSACDTGRGQITGDGVVGLSRALISAGVPSVVVSLWAVPDAPTAELMTQFYHQLETNPDKAQALRQAMLTTMNQHPDPKDWAAFTLIGETE
ncbi:tetratricopeptide repeat protein [Leptolyngbya sp. FACHB-671]|uniref:CHAT domain-containing tetratricopeptide repeat protein n=1 Tax=Leptolyngbya sp. FACHB-671 TaxID=2692812 RepID=UPI001682C825|nr:tetratricopeptide repeat protein [Leptolyngbya sp. FACHB-671]MBD2069533.1 tetratricopeptide repeat protein [Leptolyngbya sp. FACHB-671]